MSENQLIIEMLEQIRGACSIVQKRFSRIETVSDFTDSPDGMQLLDSVCMQLIAIGESLKNVDKHSNQKLLPAYPEIDWKGAMKLRDIIAHHYFDVDAEEIFFICNNQIKPLSKAISKIIDDLK